VDPLDVDRQRRGRVRRGPVRAGLTRCDANGTESVAFAIAVAGRNQFEAGIRSPGSSFQRDDATVSQVRKANLHLARSGGAKPRRAVLQRLDVRDGSELWLVRVLRVAAFCGQVDCSAGVALRHDHDSLSRAVRECIERRVNGGPDLAATLRRQSGAIGLQIGPHSAVTGWPKRVPFRDALLAHDVLYRCYSPSDSLRRELAQHAGVRR
jgi:hypothetical protein